MQVEIGDFVKVKQMLDESTVSAVLTLGALKVEDGYTYGKQRACCCRRAELPAAPPRPATCCQSVSLPRGHHPATITRPPPPRHTAPHHIPPRRTT